MTSLLLTYEIRAVAQKNLNSDQVITGYQKMTDRRKEAVADAIQQSDETELMFDGILKIA